MKKGISLKAALTGLIIGQLLIVGIINLGYSIYGLRQGMEYETTRGLLAAVQTYAEVLELTEFSEDVDNSTLETDLNASTGYDYTYFSGDTRERSSIDGVVGTTAASEIYQAVFVNGETYSQSDVEINGELYYVAYVPITHDGETFGMAFAGMKKSEIWAYINLRTRMMVLVSAGVMALMLLISILYTSKIVKAIKANVSAVNKLSSGDLSITMEASVLNRKDELGEMANSTMSMVEKLRSVIGSAYSSSGEMEHSAEYLSNTCETISQTADNVSSAVDQVAYGASNQADSLQDAVTSVEEINESIQVITDNTNHMNTLASYMQDNSKNSSLALEELKETTEETIHAIDDIVKLIENTDHAVSSISEAISIIDSIAAQTNLLSLNASIEAARAGDAGRGFSVVANEIRQLAEQSSAAAQNIQSIMQELSADSKETMDTAGSMQETAVKQNAVIQKTISHVNGLIANIDESLTVTQEIAENVEKSDKATQVFADTINSLSAISQENAASSEETRASMIDLSETVNKLSEKAKSLNSISKILEKEMSFFHNMEQSLERNSNTLITE